MSSWRSTGLALWALVTIAMSGCSSTSLPVRMVRVATGQVRPTGTVPYDRLVAIGKTFETQGNYGKAQRMYNMVLSRQPNNVEATQSLRRIAALRKNDGKVFDGGQPAGPATPAMQQQAVMMASASQPHGTPARVTQTSTTTSTRAPRRKKSVQALTASSTVPVRSPKPNTDSGFSIPTGAGYTKRSAAPPREDWSLPRVAPAPVFGNPEAGRVRMDNAAKAQPFVMPRAAAAGSALPVSSINIEACLDNPENHINELVAALASPDPDMRSLAAFLLGESGSAARPGFHLLRGRLATETSDSIRVTVAEAICKLDSSDVHAKSMLLNCMSSPDASIRSQSAFAMRVFAGSPDQHTLRALESALADTNTDVAAMAALSLSDFGAKAKPALPALEAAKNGSSQQVRDALDAAIARIRG